MMESTRREFISVGGAAVLAGCATSQGVLANDDVKYIDIHAHCTEDPLPQMGSLKQPLCCAEQLIAHYDRLGIEKGCILGLGTPENFIGGMSNESILRLCAAYPDRFIPFCVVDPRSCGNTPYAQFRDVLMHYRDRGCKGFGELCANIHLLDPRMQNLFKACEEVGLPVTFHTTPMCGWSYGVVDDSGLPALEICLQRFPKLRFFGHSSAFWSEITVCRTMQERNSRGKGPIKEEGAIQRLMRKYPNLYGDLSAGSGACALMRDPAYAAKFLTEFQDRIMFGIDICDPNGYVSPLPGFLRELRSSGAISETVFRKVARENHIRELGI
ncbi:MAG: amidohydrolase family protein [Kiritimatiellae bacterium]|nr:amidohydrolase family protein [Kiritimatiellia bacterium]